MFLKYKQTETVVVKETVRWVSSQMALMYNPFEGSVSQKSTEKTRQRSHLLHTLSWSEINQNSYLYLVGTWHEFQTRNCLGTRSKWAHCPSSSRDSVVFGEPLWTEALHCMLYSFDQTRRLGHN